MHVPVSMETSVNERVVEPHNIKIHMNTHEITLHIVLSESPNSEVLHHFDLNTCIHHTTCSKGHNTSEDLKNHNPACYITFDIQCDFCLAAFLWQLLHVWKDLALKRFFNTSITSVSQSNIHPMCSQPGSHIQQL